MAGEIDWGRAAETMKAVTKEETVTESKADYKRLTITIPPHLWELVVDEVGARKKQRNGKDGASGVVREALETFFSAR